MSNPRSCHRHTQDEIKWINKYQIAANVHNSKWTCRRGVLGLAQCHCSKSQKAGTSMSVPIDITGIWWVSIVSAGLISASGTLCVSRSFTFVQMLHTHTDIYIYMHACKDTEREKERGRKRERERDSLHFATYNPFCSSASDVFSAASRQWVRHGQCSGGEPKIIRRGTRLVVHFRDFTNLMRTVYMKFWYLNVFDGDIMINRMMLVVSLLCSTIIRMMMTMTDMFEVAWNHQSASKILRFGVLIFRGWAKQDTKMIRSYGSQHPSQLQMNPLLMPVLVACVYSTLPTTKIAFGKACSCWPVEMTAVLSHNFGEISSHKRRHVSSTYANLRWLLLRHGEGCIIPRWTRFDMKQRMNVMSCPRGLAVDNAWKCTGWFLVSLTCGSCSLSYGPRNLSGKKWTISDHQSVS